MRMALLEPSHAQGIAGIIPCAAHCQRGPMRRALPAWSHAQGIASVVPWAAYSFIVGLGAGHLTPSLSLTRRLLLTLIPTWTLTLTPTPTLTLSLPLFIVGLCAGHSISLDSAMLEIDVYKDLLVSPPFPRL